MRSSRSAVTRANGSRGHTRLFNQHPESTGGPTGPFPPSSEHDPVSGVDASGASDREAAFSDSAGTESAGALTAIERWIDQPSDDDVAHAAQEVIGRPKDTLTHFPGTTAFFFFHERQIRCA